MTITFDEAVAKLAHSKKFLNWNSQKPAPEPVRKPLDSRLFQMAEKHWTPQELAKLWGVSVQTIREVFRDEEGVLKIGRNGTRSRRRYMTLRIPESVAERVHTRLSA